MRNLFWAAASLTATLGFTTANAAVIDNGATGISGADVTIGFDEVALTDGTPVTNQFAGLGVTFSQALTYNNTVSTRPNFSGAAFSNPAGQAFSILFSQTVSSASAAITANSGGATYTSLLNGVEVEGFSTSLDLAENNFYGFTGSLFDEILIDPDGSTTIAMDNLAYTVAPVPVPAALPLLLAGIGGLGFMARRRRSIRL
ncbi:MAG: VPLPA-CTERM sorting domain-containing protein [Roseobacter sp.]